MISFLYYFQRQEVTLYGDAIAHINIARRVFDSKTPGLLQLGTVWLPLPHLLMIPFVISNDMWRRGAGGSIPSLVAYVFAVIGMFRMVRSALSRGGSSGKAVPDAPARIAAWSAAVIFAANPNLIYMQTTAMGEALYLAFFIWAVVYCGEYFRGDGKALNKCGFCLAAACLIRYDGWFLAAAIAASVVLRNIVSQTIFRRTTSSEKPANAKLSATDDEMLRPASPTRAQLARFLLIAAAAPMLWLAYNGIVYRNPLEFENGPYSAKAIEARTQTPGSPGHPGSGNLFVAGLYFVKSGDANVAGDQWLQRMWILLTIAAIAAAVLYRSALTPAWPLLFLLMPLPFYALSIAYGGVPIFVPEFWPFTRYNVRYGLQLLPAFACAMAILICLILRSEARKLRLRLAFALAVFLFVTASYALVWRSEPICLQEAEINMRGRNQLETQLAEWLERLPTNATLLMYLGDHVGAVQQAGIPLRQVINEGNHRVWKQPFDPQGLWERALADPARYADYALAFQGDRVWDAVEGKHFFALVEIHVTGQPPAILYRLR